MIKDFEYQIRANQTIQVIVDMAYATRHLRATTIPGEIVPAFNLEKIAKFFGEFNQSHEPGFPSTKLVRLAAIFSVDAEDGEKRFEKVAHVLAPYWNFYINQTPHRVNRLTALKYHANTFAIYVMSLLDLFGPDGILRIFVTDDPLVLNLAAQCRGSVIVVGPDEWHHQHIERAGFTFFSMFQFIEATGANSQFNSDGSRWIPLS